MVRVLCNFSFCNVAAHCRMSVMCLMLYCHHCCLWLSKNVFRPAIVRLDPVHYLVRHPRMREPFDERLCSQHLHFRMWQLMIGTIVPRIQFHFLAQLFHRHLSHLLNHPDGFSCVCAVYHLQNFRGAEYLSPNAWEIEIKLYI